MRIDLPYGWSPHTLFVKPYKLGAETLLTAISENTLPRSERITRTVIGIALCAPLLGTITLIVLKILFPHGIRKSNEKLIECERFYWAATTSWGRDLNLWRAAELLAPQLDPHQAKSGRIDGNQFWGKWMQIPALSQGEASNNLCGYYALFFALQWKKDLPLDDKQAFDTQFSQWSKLIQLKRLTLKLDKPPFPDSIEPVDIGGLAKSELQLLMSEETEPLGPNWLFYETRDEASGGEFHKMGEIDLSSNKFYAIARFESHYHCIIIEGDERVTAHSLEYPSLEICRQNFETFEKEFTTFSRTLAQRAE